MYAAVLHKTNDYDVNEHIESITHVLSFCVRSMALWWLSRIKIIALIAIDHVWS